MKLLRVLTGIHAGAQLQLMPGTHRIGTDDNADIRLTDRRGTDVLLHVGADGAVSAQRLGEQRADLDDAQNVPNEVVLLADFAPIQFDDTILCIGPNHTPWPPDIDLLSTLLTRPAEERVAAERTIRRWYAGVASVFFVLAVLIAVGSLLMTTTLTRATLPRNADDHALLINRALVSAHISGLHARALGNTVVVSGMVTTPADDAAVRNLLNRISPTGISRNYDVALNDARSLEDAIGIAGAHVTYLGNANFAVVGTVKNRSALDTALNRVRADLNSNIKGVVVQATEATDGGAITSASYSEIISSDDVSYAQTPDGIKHIYAVEPTATNDASSTGNVGTTSYRNSGVTDTGVVDNDIVSRSANSYTSLPDLPILPASSKPHSPAD